MTEQVELHRISFLDLLLTVATSGLWILFIYWFNRVQVPASAIEQVAK
jgi:hypothetical protein